MVMWHFSLVVSFQFREQKNDLCCWYSFVLVLIKYQFSNMHRIYVLTNGTCIRGVVIALLTFFYCSSQGRDRLGDKPLFVLVSSAAWSKQICGATCVMVVLVSFMWSSRFSTALYYGRAWGWNKGFVCSRVWKRLGSWR